MIRIGNTELRYGLALAPLSGITDSSFRRICKSFGAELVFSEMVSSEGIKRRMRKSLEYLYFTDTERPIGIQIFGSKSGSMAEAARIIDEDFHPDVIDINLGCPVKKVIKTGAGAALLKDLRRLEKLVNGVVKSVSIPVSAKIRLGWHNDNSLEVSKLLEGCGITFLTVHSRKAIDGYGIKADWSVYEKIKRNISIPLIANGDIVKPEDAAYLLNEIGVDGVMIGRGALGKPWVFETMKDFIENGRLRKEPTIDEKMKLLLEQIELMEDRIGEARTVKRIKKQIQYYLRGIQNVKMIKQEILATKRLKGMVTLLHSLETEFSSPKKEE